MDKDKNLSASFKKDPVFIMTLKKSDDSDGLGSIFANHGLTLDTCDTTCGSGAILFVQDQDPTVNVLRNNVTLTAKAEDGSKFDSWISGDCIGTNPSCSFVMNQDRVAIAKFVKIQSIDYKLTLSRAGEGLGSIDVSPPSIPLLSLSSLGTNASSIIDAFSLSTPQDVNVILKAISASGSVFTSWSGDASNCGVSADCTIKIGSASKNVEAIANFSKIPIYNITVNKQGTGRGSISSSVRSFSKLNILLISSADFPFIIEAILAQAKSSKGLRSK
jgi:hypothetical protein